MEVGGEEEVVEEGQLADSEYWMVETGQGTSRQIQANLSTN